MVQLALTPLLVVVVLGATASADPYPPLHETAPTVREPARVLLVSVARAGDRLVAAGEHGVIIFSDDNGHSWTQAAVPVTLTVTSLGFANAKEGWAAGAYGAVLHTTDGGAVWERQITGIEVNQLMTASASAAASADPTAGAAVAAVRRATILAAAGPDKPFLSVQALDPKRAMIFGSYRTCLITEDAGTHWADCSLNVQDPVSHNLYDSQQIGSSIFLSGEVGTVFRSTDGGKTFVMTKPDTDTTMFGIVGTPKGTLVTYGVAGTMFRSTDNGQTWARVKMSTDSNITAGVILKSGQVAVVTEAGNLFISSDDGMSFRAAPRNEGMGLFGIAQAANGDVVLVGSTGVVVVPGSTLS